MYPWPMFAAVSSLVVPGVTSLMPDDFSGSMLSFQPCTAAPTLNWDPPLSVVMSGSLKPIT